MLIIIISLIAINSFVLAWFLARRVYKNRWQKQVYEFMETMDQVPNRNPGEGVIGFFNKELCVNLIKEEYEETIEAINNQDMVEFVDGACDLIYVILFAANSFGVDLYPAFEEVQRSNIAKKGGPIGPDGKRLKPDNWTPPNIKDELFKQISSYKNIKTRLYK